ncbi:MAG: hypothetical protein FJZ16_05535 [Candidatus Omnitrophica bacterium]|nr:hypothetical protein [Candidatus Omnitrophota bacterium]
MPNAYSEEKLLIKVIGDLADFLPYLVLVGGWVPYVYAKYIWKNVPNLAVTTTDIDFGVVDKEFKGKVSVASYVRKLGYGERHVSMDRMFPFIPVVKDPTGSLKAEVEFIVDPKISKKIINKIVGREIKINEIENFSLLLKSVTTVSIDKHKIQIPTESMFVFHKLLTFVQRENAEKLKKDLYYAYYILRFYPDKEHLINSITLLCKNSKEGKEVKRNIHNYFSSVDSEGPILIEQENGPDAYIDDLRQDIFGRFNKLREVCRFL